MNSALPENIKAIRDNLGSISPTFCLAKWLRVTLDLEKGLGKSCELPRFRNIPVEPLKQSPHALHNTIFQKSVRKVMLDGGKPADCHLCWKTEEGSGNISERFLKSEEFQYTDFIRTIKNLTFSENINPTQVEVIFSHQDSVYPIYQNPTLSELRTKTFLLPFEEKKRKNRLENRRLIQATPKENPFEEAFWHWLPELSKTMTNIKVSGGEPILQQSTLRLLNFFEAHANPNLSLEICSHLSMKNAEPFFQKIKCLLEQKKIRSFTLHTNIDSSGAHAEYIYPGLRYKTFLTNLDAFLSIVPGHVKIHSKFSVLSAPKYLQFLQDILLLNNKHSTSHHGHKKISIVVQGLSEPIVFSPILLTREWKRHLVNIEHFVEANAQTSIGPYGFSHFEIESVRKIKNWILSSGSNEEIIAPLRTELYEWIQATSKTTKTSFAKTFPELKAFFLLAKLGYHEPPDFFPESKPITTTRPQREPPTIKRKPMDKNAPQFRTLKEERDYYQKNNVKSFRALFLSEEPLFLSAKETK